MTTNSEKEEGAPSLKSNDKTRQKEKEVCLITYANNRLPLFSLAMCTRLPGLFETCE